MGFMGYIGYMGGSGNSLGGFPTLRMSDTSTCFPEHSTHWTILKFLTLIFISLNPNVSGS